MGLFATFGCNSSTTQRCRSETEKNIKENLFSSVLSQFKKYHPSETLNLLIWAFFKLKISYFNGKNPFNFS